ncbi:MAG: hypothetical protein ACODAJ_10135, partial [Planctomycetota bacterium]
MDAMLTEARRHEAAYLAGVRANLERYAVELAREALAVSRPRLAVSTGSERNLVRDRALRGGLD